MTQEEKMKLITWGKRNLEPSYDVYNDFFDMVRNFELIPEQPPVPRLQLAGMLAAGLMEKNWQNTKKGTCEIATIAFHYADELIAEHERTNPNK